MTIRVNGVEIDDAAVAQELPRHSRAPDPLDAARQTLVLRQLMLQDANRLGIQEASEDETLATLMEQKIHIDPPGEAECQAFFEENREAFVRKAQIEASHILFKSDEDPQQARAQAGQVLAELRANPGRFEELARAHSACPSAEQGGSLGLVSEGQMVPEFERALFALADHQLGEELVETQFGLHIVKSGARAAATPVTFEEARMYIERFLRDRQLNQAMNAYLKELADQAVIEGYQLPF